MTTLNLVFKEIVHRKINFLLGLLAVTTAVALFVSFASTGRAYRRETRRTMRNMGQNLRIIPAETRMDKFWSVGFSEHVIPEEYVHRFASLRCFSYAHLTATLQKKVLWRDMNVILTGILPEVAPLDKINQKPMTFSVKPGTAYIGFELARSLGIKKGDVIDVFGTALTVVECLSQSGTNDDIRIYGHLHDIQRILGLEGKINEIKALECLCVIESSKEPIDPLAIAKKELAEILPDAKVILLKGIAEIRQKQRAAMEGYLAFIMLFVAIACGAWIGALAMINVRERQQEIGIMMALGYNWSKIALLFLAKSVIIGLMGAVIGFLIGMVLALNFGPSMFKLTANAIRPEYSLLVLSLIAAPVFVSVFSFIPTMYAVTCDPADTLRKE